MSAKKTKVLLLIGALILSVLLFIAPRTIAKSNDKVLKNNPVSFEKANIEMYVNQAIKLLEPNLKAKLDRFLTAQALDSVTDIWSGLKRPDIASYYTEKMAVKDTSALIWLKAGSRYYYAVQFCEDKSEAPLLYQSAMRCFKKTLGLEPGNTDAKILLASCYVEGTESPMDGISLLREVEKTDSNNVKLQLAFAFFSVKSGQLDKAISRFNKALKADSTYLETYLHLADAYERQGQTEKTITMLQRYAQKTPNVTARLEVEKYIQQLKTNINK